MRTPLVVTAAGGVGLLIGGLGMILAGGWTAEGALQATRLTARWAFPLFLLAWTASSLAFLWPGGWRSRLLRRRRAAGLAFAAAHFVHLGFILLAVGVFALPADPVAVYIGGFVYVLVAAMAVSSNDAAIRFMGPWWRRLHTVGGVLVLLVFTNSYASRILEKPLLSAPATALILAAVGVKLAALARRRSLAAA